MMARKSKTVDKIAAKFTVKTLPTMEGDYDYKGISVMMRLLYANAATLPTPHGGGDHGHIGIIMMEIIYKNTGTMDESFKNQFIDAVKDTYI